jgi:hypothetical protein
MAEQRIDKDLLLDGGRLTVRETGCSDIILKPRLTPVDAHTLARFAFDEAPGATTFVNAIAAAGNLTRDAGTVLPGIGGGMFGSCVGLNGGARIKSGNGKFEPAAAITVSAWIRPYLYHTYYGRTVSKSSHTATWAAPYSCIELCNFDNDETGSAEVRVNSLDGSRALVIPEGVVPLYQWSFVALTYDGTTVRSYVNGVEIANGALTGNIDYHDSGPWFIGCPPTLTNQDFKGHVDDFRIEDTARSAAYLLDVYQRATMRW